MGGGMGGGAIACTHVALSLPPPPPVPFIQLNLPKLKAAVPSYILQPRQESLFFPPHHSLLLLLVEKVCLTPVHATCLPPSYDLNLPLVSHHYLPCPAPPSSPLTWSHPLTVTPPARHLHSSTSQPLPCLRHYLTFSLSPSFPSLLFLSLCRSDSLLGSLFVFSILSFYCPTLGKCGLSVGHYFIICWLS